MLEPLVIFFSYEPKLNITLLLCAVFVLVAKLKKPTKEERIAEKKAKRRAEEKGVEQESKPKTAEEELEEKLKQQRLQEESDLAVAMETFGVKHKLIDTMEPKSEEEFTEFQEALTAKISKFEVNCVFMVMTITIVTPILALYVLRPSSVFSITHTKIGLCCNHYVLAMFSNVMLCSTSKGII